MGFLSGVGGNLVGGALGLFGQSMANSANISMANANRAWQEHMSSTAHQREVEDLRKAGLNPILSVTGGTGASTPSGSVAHIDNPLSPMADALSQSVNSAIAYKQMEADTALKREQEKSVTNSAFANFAQGVLSMKNAELVEQNTRKASNEADASALNTALNQARLSYLLAQASQSKTSSALQSSQIDYWREHGEREKILKEADDLTKGEAELLMQGGKMLIDGLESGKGIGHSVWDSVKNFFNGFKKKNRIRRKSDQDIDNELREVQKQLREHMISKGYKF